MAVGIVLRTGFITQKGQIFRSVLFPAETKFEFFMSLVKFIAFSFGIVILSFPGYAMALYNQGFSAGYIILIFFGTMVDVTPPALPVLISIALGGGLRRMKKLNI